MNAYELERAARIETNKQRMRAMGLGQGGALRVAGLADAPTAALVHLDASGLAGPTGSAPKWNKGKGGLKRTSQETVAPARSSRRQRGIDTEGTQTDTPKPVVSYAEGNDEQQAKRRGLAFPDPANFVASEIAAPFSLRSIGVTVHSLGDVFRGAFKQRYWSNPGCLFHHAYPAGYVASKHHFGTHYEMRIDTSEVGPVFRVTNTQTGLTFTGHSPTKPWTEHCLAMKTKTRISGPLFFGFSDPITMRALAQSYDATEMKACVSGDKVDLVAGDYSREPCTDLERLVGELRAGVDGLGEHAAIAIARTTELTQFLDVGGATQGASGSCVPRRLQSLSEVKRCAAFNNGEAMTKFLLTNHLIGESARRWPAWRARVVPRIVDSLRQGETSFAARKEGSPPTGGDQLMAVCEETETAVEGPVLDTIVTSDDPVVDKSADKPWTAACVSARRDSATPTKTGVDRENVPPALCAKNAV